MGSSVQESLKAERFWETKSLEELNEEEWEALCDGCGQCCRVRFQDTESKRVANTTIICQLFDMKTRRCTNYADRHQLVPACVHLSVERVEAFSWLPSTCAYRLRAAGLPLEDWHPLNTGTPDTVRRAGVSVDGQVIPEHHVHPADIELHILKWV